MDQQRYRVGAGPRERVGVVGAGYVGLVTAACFAALGHEVVVRDIDAVKVSCLNDGQVPFYEPGLAEIIADNRERLTFTMSLQQLVQSAEFIFIAVGTPGTPSGDADLSSVMTVLDEMAGLERERAKILIMKSTVPVGSGRRFMVHMASRGLDDVSYVANPEFLREGFAIADFMRPERIVIGAKSDAAADRVQALYQPLEAPILRTTVASAEMIKYASNAFLATKISFINEIANVCDEVGADVEVVARGMGYDSRIGPRFLRPGIGYGGSCFPKDVAALKQLAGNSGYHFQLLASVIEVNELQKRLVVTKLRRHLGELDGTEIALLGLSFKPGTDDLREASSIVLASRLIAEGARVRGYDPLVSPPRNQALPGVRIHPSAESAIEAADAAVVVTEWPAIVGLDWPALRTTMRRPVVIDGRNALDPTIMRSAGFAYEGIGRPAA